ncbi:MAG: arsenate reductase [Pelistega sp.]|nr:arsenate reductase [Pelistega sp.]
MIKVYGIKNCSTCVKALKWLEVQGKSFEFIDYRAQPIAPETILTWAAELGWAKLINKASTSWRGLSEEQKQASTDTEFLALLAEFPTLMKRPVLLTQNRIILGFKPEAYEEFFA